VSQLNSSAVKVFFIIVGEEAKDDTCLGDLASTGGTNSLPFIAKDTDMLQSDLTFIAKIASPASCIIELNFTPENPNLVVLRVFGKEVPREPNTALSGWDYYPGSSTLIVVRGDDCKDLQVATSMHSQVTVLTGCPPCG